jgi:predicted permease
MRSAGRREALYRLLLRAYPRSFRQAHQDEMVSWFLQHAARTAERAGFTAWTGFWYLVIKDFLWTIAAQYREEIVRVAQGRPHREGGGSMDGVLQDARIALRSFARRPAFFVLAVATVGLGVGSTTTVYSVVRSVVLAPLPYEEADRLVRVGEISEGRAGILSMSALDLRDVQERNRSFEALAASRPASMTVGGDGEPELMRVATVSAEFFPVMRVAPVFGRAWTPEADEPGGDALIVLGHDLWRRRWGGDPDLVGQTIDLNGTPFQVIGIMPADFLPPEALGQSGVEGWIPLAYLDPEARSQRENGFLQVIGRLRAGATLEVAVDELRALGDAISDDFPGPGRRVFGLSPLHTETVGGIGGTMATLLGAVTLLLGIACVNVANLLLVRASGRTREMALRHAIGARRTRLLRQLLTESLILGFLGGLLGAAIAVAGVHAFARFGPRQIPRLAEIGVSGPVLWAALGLALFTSLFFGLLPALRGSRGSLRQGLGSGSAGGGGSSIREAHLRDVLVIAETSLSVVLVVAGGLLLNSFVRLTNVDPGFESRNVSVISVAYPGNASGDEVVSFYDELLTRVSGLPGVRAAGATVNLPLSGNGQMLRVQVPGMTMSAQDVELGGYPVNYQQVTPDYFRAMGIAVRRGRVFEPTDDAAAAPVALVNETLARALVGEGDIPGLRFTFGHEDAGAEPHEVVGVVADVRQQQLEAPGEPELYLSFHQSPRTRMEVVARGSGDGASLLPAMRQQLWAVRPDLPTRRSAEMSDVVSQSIADQRFYTLLMGTFAGLALALALVGVYGTLSFAVSQRQRELGVRVALGAAPSSLLRMVLGRGMTTVAAGMAIGLGAALLTTRVMESLLFGITPTDPLTLAVGLAAVVATAAAACTIPARRAARLDPTISLRAE